MGFQVFTEKEISIALLKKAPLVDIKGKKHKIGSLVIDGKYYGKVKIPNPHKNEFRSNKASNLAKQLKIGQDDYNEFIKCTLSTEGYIKSVKKSQSE